MEIAKSAPVSPCRQHPRRHAEQVLPRSIASQALQELGIRLRHLDSLWRPHQIARIRFGQRGVEIDEGVIAEPVERVGDRTRGDPLDPLHGRPEIPVAV